MPYTPEPSVLAKKHEKDILSTVAKELDAEITSLNLMPEESFAIESEAKCGFLVLGPKGLVSVHAKINESFELTDFVCAKVK
jgi:hypothetical protein